MNPDIDVGNAVWIYAPGLVVSSLSTSLVSRYSKLTFPPLRRLLTSPRSLSITFSTSPSLTTPRSLPKLSRQTTLINLSEPTTRRVKPTTTFRKKLTKWPESRNTLKIQASSILFSLFTFTYRSRNFDLLHCILYLSKGRKEGIVNAYSILFIILFYFHGPFYWIPFLRYLPLRRYSNLSLLRYLRFLHAHTLVSLLKTFRGHFLYPSSPSSFSLLLYLPQPLLHVVK